MNLADSNLTIKNYKEPLLKIPRSEGYGYWGTLIGSLDGETVQCHICGKLFRDVGVHARQAHKINVVEYREKFKLARLTSLISESIRQERKERTLQYIRSLSPKELIEWKEKARRGAREWKKNNPNRPWKDRLETKNKRGTCPDQLLAKIQEIADKVGQTPTLAEFITLTGGQRYKHLIFTTFGSWKNALKMLKMTPRDNHGNQTDRRRNRRYTDEQLIESLIMYTIKHRKIPTVSDCKRGLIPSYYIFKGHFRNFENARQLANVYQFVD